MNILANLMKRKVTLKPQFLDLQTSYFFSLIAEVSFPLKWLINLLWPINVELKKIFEINKGMGASFHFCVFGYASIPIIPTFFA